MLAQDRQNPTFHHRACFSRGKMRTWCAALAASAALVSGAAAAELEVKRVALFNSGVGYFDCVTTVNGDESAELSFRTDQINDILKSLVVQDLDGGKIAGVSYTSQDPIEKTLKSFGVDITGKPTLAQLLDQLRGEPVELTGLEKVQGVILGVEWRSTAVDSKTINTPYLNLLSSNGMQQFNIDELRGVRLLNEKVAGELNKALATLALSHDADKKSVVIDFQGSGARRVRAGYLLETPVWKTSYRLVLSEKDEPFLQGWATVENATEEDWKDVRLSLVSGRPISFRMDLYTPIYVPRPIEQLDLYASLQAPEFAAGRIQSHGGMVDMPAAPSAGVTPEMAKSLGRLDNLTARSYDQDGASFLDESRGPIGGGVESVASAQEAGELFEYTIDTPVSIPRQHSAMLPIVNQAISGKKVSIFNPQVHFKHPLNGLELVNATELHLTQGPVTVFDGNTYAGDAKLPDLRPQEKRLVAYALDLATEVKIERKPRVDQLVKLRIAKGTLISQHKYVEALEYEVKNKGEKPRDVIIEHLYDNAWTLVEPKEPFEKTDNLLRFRLAAKPNDTTRLPVRLERMGDTTVALSDTDFDNLRWYLKTSVMTPGIERAIERVIDLRTELSRLDRTLATAETSLNETQTEQGRIRDNLRVLPQNTDQYARQLQQFDAFESQIEELRRSVAEARKAREAKVRELETFLVSLNIE